MLFRNAFVFVFLEDFFTVVLLLVVRLRGTQFL